MNTVVQSAWKMLSKGQYPKRALFALGANASAELLQEAKRVLLDRRETKQILAVARAAQTVRDELNDLEDTTASEALKTLVDFASEAPGLLSRAERAEDEVARLKNRLTMNNQSEKGVKKA